MSTCIGNESANRTDAPGELGESGFESTTHDLFGYVGNADLERMTSDPLPESVDWRQNGMVSPVKNQGRCAACWAFSIVGSVESHIRIHLNQFEILSEQFLIDCGTDVDNDGCPYAPLLKSLAYIVTHLGGVLRSEDYHSYAERKLKCQWVRPSRRIENHGSILNSSTVPQQKDENDNVLDVIFNKVYSPVRPVPVIGFRRVQADEAIMEQFVHKYGPLIAAINSATMVGNYSGYIDEPTDENCDPGSLTHTVLIVGYSTHVPSDGGRIVRYWIIKNSWGTEWGDNGYYYLVRGRNACGIAADVAIPIVN
ncbi:hypothetical protein ACJJTC_018365 [Scirpophaga incertulas]